MRVLVVEDDQQISRQVVQALKSHGYVTDTAANGEDGRFLGQTESYDAVILDLSLPVLDGLSVLQTWRREGIKTPVLVLTVRNTWLDKVKGLRAGADDYLSKPFHIEELMARIEALVRRDKGSVRSLLIRGDVQFDTETGQVTRHGREVVLTALEHRLLAYLMHRPNAIVSKSELIEHIYGQDFDKDSNVIEVLVNRLRKKFGAGFITTRRGLGYMIGDDPDTT
ncbi:MAG TPA: response regulator transcription factor [Burkholderiales bacterium]|jgi:two-component system OmpR family response regulator|nr:response regulator transcription factor [Burkholderiales bacterium]